MELRMAETAWPEKWRHGNRSSRPPWIPTPISSTPPSYNSYYTFSPSLPSDALLIVSRPLWEPMEGPQTEPSSSGTHSLFPKKFLHFELILLCFRGFQDGSDRIRIYTDSRSCEIEEIKHCPFGEICWYFTESWEQFRINGKIEIIDKSTTDAIKVEQREKSWQSISEKPKLQYLGPAPRSPYKEELGIGYELDPSAGPLDAFSLLVLEPDQVDYINLKSNERWIFTSRMSDSDKIWMRERVNP